MSLSASEAFDLLEIGRCDHGGNQWVVFTDGAYRHVVGASHFDSCGRSARETDEEHRADDYGEWCSLGVWANDFVAGEVAALCDLAFVHSATSGGCGRIAAKEVSDE